MSKILIIDDEKDIIETLGFRLEASGFDVISANDGVEGLEKAQKEKPDLIILDVMMPKMDGYQVCRLLKFDESTQHVPVILLTARGQDRDRKIWKDVGADAYISKPYDSVQLVARVQELCPEGS